MVFYYYKSKRHYQIQEKTTIYRKVNVKYYISFNFHECKDIRRSERDSGFEKNKLSSSPINHIWGQRESVHILLVHELIIQTIFLIIFPYLSQPIIHFDIILLS